MGYSATTCVATAGPSECTRRPRKVRPPISRTPYERPDLEETEAALRPKGIDADTLPDDTDDDE
jgi:hypothetical protein